MSDRRRPRDLPLFVKLLLPFLVLLLVVGASGTFVVVRDLSSRARAQLNQELLVRSLDVRSRLHDRELYLLESVDFAANLDEMADAVARGRTEHVAQLLRSVAALKAEVSVLSVVEARGATITTLSRAGAGSEPVASTDPVADGELMEAALRSDGTVRPARMLVVGGIPHVVIATPICTGRDACEPAGVVIAGQRVDLLVDHAAGKAVEESASPHSIAIYDGAQLLVASSGPVPVRRSPNLSKDGLLRLDGRVGNESVSTLYAPLIVQEQLVGSFSTTIGVAPSMSAARSAAVRLAILLLAAMAGVLAIGALLSRAVVAQIRQVVGTSRALGRGDLNARAPVSSRDELGELARVLNQMADQLRASHETLERQVDERTQAIRELLAERTDFFTGISHELRTPVAVILSEARMMLDPAYGRSGPGSTNAAETIVRSAEQLLSQVNQILDLARMEAGRTTVDLTEVWLPQVIEGLRPTIAGLVAAGDLDLAIDVPRSLPTVRADPNRLRDVILNLVSNAVKYTAPGGSVTVKAHTRGGRVTLEVTDTGVGIPADVGDRVFEPFYRVPGTRPERDQPSSGLGLALAKRLTEAQRGTIEYRSNGRGTTFAVTLPTQGKRERGRARRTRATADT